MFWLRNELFGFPVNDCDYESISCERSYIPVLNWDKENEFTWSLADPYGTDIDANNVSFNTRSAARPSDTTSVARALEELMSRINESNCKFDITDFKLTIDWDNNVVWTLSYKDNQWRPHTINTWFNLKDAIENIDDLTLEDLTVDNLTAKENLESLGNTKTNWINNTWSITTESLSVSQNSQFGWDVTINGTTTTNWINNTWDITNSWLIETNDVKVNNNMIVDWLTELNTLNVNWESTFKDEVKVLDNLYVSWDTVLNSDLRVSWDEIHNWDVVYNGDVIIHWELQADELDLNLSEYQKKEEKGMARWYASLDSTGKVPFSQLPNITGWINYKGEWDASTGAYPTNPSAWDMYYISVAGTINSTAYNIGDRIIYDADNDVWLQLPDNYGVISVNGRTGIVVDVQDITDRKNAIDLNNPATNKYLSEKAVADLVNPLIDRIEELERHKTSIIALDLPSVMNEDTDYTVVEANITSNTHIVILDTNTTGNIVITPANWYVTVRSSANENNPTVNVLAVK